MSIYLGEGRSVSDMQGPCPDGFHVPLKTEWQAIYDAGVSLGAWTSSGGSNFSTYLKLPMAGDRNYDKTVYNVGSSGAFWCSSYDNDNNYSRYIRFSPSNMGFQVRYRSYGHTVRCVKNSPTIPTTSWTVLYQGSGSAGIFHNPTDGLISISSDGTTWYTIMDKNLGATTVYNYGDTLTDANCGNVFQRGNNYGFPGTLSSDSITTSSTRVNTTGYGPGNYYNSSTWINYSGNWSRTSNNNLRGGVSQGSGKKPGIKEIYLGEGKTVIVSDMQGPCDDGFHVPTKDEFQGLINTLSSIGYSGYNNIKSYLKLPPAGYYSQRGSLTNKGSTMGYWTCSPNGSYSYYLESSSSYTGFYGQGRCYGATIRPFKDEFIIPDSTWTVILGTIGSSGVFWNQNDGIISVTSNGTTGYTIADKNLGATTVYDNGTATDANCGSYFQWGNNYGFPSSGITTSSSQVNASTYGPGNYYSSSTFIAYASNPYNWDNSNNTNLRGGVSQGSSSRIEPNAKEVYIGTTKVRPKE